MLTTALLSSILSTSLALPAPRPEPRFELGLTEVYEALSAAAERPAKPAWAVPDLVGVGRPSGQSFDEPGFGRRLALDLVALGRSPFEMDSRGWKRFGLGLALVGAAAMADDELNEGVDRFRDDVGVRAGRAVRPLGQEGGLALLGATWLIGRGLDRPQLVNFAKDGVEATILSAIVVAPLKELVGRTRPRDTGSAQAFSVFSGEKSFPSGEATQAFALAAVVAGHTSHRWVKVTAYGLAGLISMARIELDGHWASDVVAGALIGHAIGRFVVKRHGRTAEREGKVHWQVTPGYDRERHAWSLGGAISF